MSLLAIRRVRPALPMISALVLGAATAAADDTIYFANLFSPTIDDGSVSRITTGGFDLQTVTPTGGGIRSLDVDPVGGKVYWTDVNNYAIRRANLDGSGVQDLVTTGLVFPAGIAVDAAGGKFYWGDQVDESIWRADLDGANVEFVTSTPFHRGIAIDHAGGKVYWSTSTNVTTGDIRRCNFDGGGIEIVIPNGGANFKPANIALDVADGKIYWTDYVAGQVRRANLDGTGMDNLYATHGLAPRGIRLDLTNGWVYWGQDFGDETTTGRIQRMPLDGTFNELIAWDLGLVNDLAIVFDQPPQPCTGDLNNDSTVDLQDLALLLAHYGTPGGASAAEGDLDADGDVDLQDLATLLAIFGTTCP